MDSNYWIRILQSWNPHHQPTLADLEHRLNARHLLHLIPHTLLETFSVMKRMPEPFRKPPALVNELMTLNFRDFPLIAAPPAEEAWRLIADLAQKGLGGG